MPRIDPSLVPLVIDLERGLRELRIPFAIVGALVPELLLDARPHRMTNDADVTVVVQRTTAATASNMTAAACRSSTPAPTCLEGMPSRFSMQP